MEIVTNLPDNGTSFRETNTRKRKYKALDINQIEGINLDTSSCLNVFSPSNIEYFNKPLLDPNILCWHCCHNFTTPPKSLPMQLSVKPLDVIKNEHHKAKVRYRVKFRGIFCLWGCAKAYTRILPETQRNMSCALIGIVAKARDGISLAMGIKESLPKEVQEAFGGDISREEYLRLCDTTTSQYNAPCNITILVNESTTYVAQNEAYIPANMKIKVPNGKEPPTFKVGILNSNFSDISSTLATCNNATSRQTGPLRGLTGEKRTLYESLGIKATQSVNKRTKQ